MTTLIFEVVNETQGHEIEYPIHDCVRNSNRTYLNLFQPTNISLFCLSIESVTRHKSDLLQFHTYLEDEVSFLINSSIH
jgi:hypothetical protein